MSTIEELQQQLTEKDNSLNAIKEKTKVFITKMREDHSNEMTNLNNEITALKQQQQESHDKLDQAKVFLKKLKEENDSLKVNSESDQTKIKNLEATLQQSTV